MMEHIMHTHPIAQMNCQMVIATLWRDVDTRSRPCRMIPPVRNLCCGLGFLAKSSDERGRTYSPTETFVLASVFAEMTLPESQGVTERLSPAMLQGTEVISTGGLGVDWKGREFIVLISFPCCWSMIRVDWKLRLELLVSHNSIGINNIIGSML